MVPKVAGSSPVFHPLLIDDELFILFRFVLGNHVFAQYVIFFVYTLRLLNSEQTIAVATATFSDSDVFASAG